MYAENRAVVGEDLELLNAVSGAWAQGNRRAHGPRPFLGRRLLDQINEVHSQNRAVEEDVSEIQRRRAKDQSRIAWVIIWAFVVAVSAIFVLVVGSILAGNGDIWKAPAEFLLGIVSSVLLPVVTLVLGYYFGREKK